VTAPVALAGVLPAGSSEWTAPLDVSVADGEWLVVRTTPARSSPLLRICVGLQSRAAGTVSVLGEDPGQLSNAALGPFRRRLGTALQPDGLVSNMGVRRNLVVSLVYAGVCGAAEAEARAREGLEQFGLASWAEARPSDLPEDVRAIVAVVRAVARRPAVLVLEDPFAAVKSVQAAAMLRRCRALAPSALVTTFRRNEPLYDAADRIALWDSRGFTPAEAPR
jgi:ABC-type methionine transport system ATPase subunit